MRKSFYNWLYRWAFCRFAEIQTEKKNQFRHYLVVLNHEEWTETVETIGAESVRITNSVLRANDPNLEGFLLQRKEIIKRISAQLESAINRNI